MQITAPTEKGCSLDLVVASPFGGVRSHRFNPDLKFDLDRFIGFSPGQAKAAGKKPHVATVILILANAVAPLSVRISGVLLHLSKKG